MRKANKILSRALGLLMAGSLSLGGSFLQAAPVYAAESGSILNNCCSSASLSDQGAAVTDQKSGTTAVWNVDPTKEYKLTLSFSENGSNKWNGQEMVYEFPSFFQPSVTGKGGISGTSQSGVTKINGDGVKVSAYYEIGPDGKLHVYPNGSADDYSKLKNTTDDKVSVDVNGYFASEGTGKGYAFVSGSAVDYTVAFYHPFTIRNVNINGEVLADGEFEILNLDGDKQTVQLTRDSKGLIQLSLPTGSYQLKQTKAPTKVLSKTSTDAQSTSTQGDSAKTATATSTASAAKAYQKATAVNFKVGEDGVVSYSSSLNGTLVAADENTLDIVNLTGEADDPAIGSTTLKLNGHIVFEDNNDADKLRPNKGGVKLHLFRDKKEVASATINESHKWEFKGNDIPLADASRYELTVDPISVKEGQNPYTITVNKYVDEQRLFFNVVAVHIAKNSSASTSKSGSAVKTGDNGKLLHYLFLFLAAGAVCVVLFRVKNDRRRKNQFIGFGLSVVMAASMAAGVGVRDASAEVISSDVVLDDSGQTGTDDGKKIADPGDSKSVSDGSSSGSSSKNNADGTADDGKESVHSGSDGNGQNAVVSPTGKAADDKADNSKSRKNKKKVSVKKKDTDEELVKGTDEVIMVGGSTLKLLNPYIKTVTLSDGSSSENGETWTAPKQGEDSFIWDGLSAKKTYKLKLTLTSTADHRFAADATHAECAFALPANFRFADQGMAAEKTIFTIKSKDKGGNDYTLEGNTAWGEMTFEAEEQDATTIAKAAAHVQPMLHVKFNVKDVENLEKFVEDEAVTFTLETEVYIGAGATEFVNTADAKVTGTVTTKEQRIVNICAQTSASEPLDGVEYELLGSERKQVAGVPKWTSRRSADGKIENSLHAVLLEDGIYYLHVASIPEGVTKPTEDLTLTVGGSTSGLSVSGGVGGMSNVNGTAYAFISMQKTSPKKKEVKVTIQSLNADLTPITGGDPGIKAKTDNTIGYITGDDYTLTAGYGYTLQEKTAPSGYKKAADRPLYVDSAGHLFLNSGEIQAKDPQKVESGYLLKVLHIKEGTTSNTVHIWAQTSWNDMENLDNCRPTDLTITVRKSTQSTALYDDEKVGDKEKTFDFKRQPSKDEKNKDITYTVSPKKTPTKDYTVAVVDKYTIDGTEITTIIYRHVPKKTPSSTPKATATPAPTATQKAAGSSGSASSSSSQAGATATPTVTVSTTLSGSPTPGASSSDSSAGQTQGNAIRATEADSDLNGSAPHNDDKGKGEDVEVEED